jgi:hypothetical protein
LRKESSGARNKNRENFIGSEIKGKRKNMVASGF